MILGLLSLDGFILYMAKSLCIEQWHEDICTEEGFSFFTAEVIDNSLETIFM